MEPGILHYVPLPKLLRTASVMLALGLGLTGCSLFQNSPEPPPPPPPSSDEEVDPNSAAGRQAEFDAALEEAWQEDDPVNRDRYIEALVDAGFDTEHMEATSEVDSLGGSVTQLEIAIRIGDTCIVGQAGELGTRSVLAAPLQTGLCLIGDTPPID